MEAKIGIMHLQVRKPFKPHVAVTHQEYFEDFNKWFALYGATATTDHLKPPASRKQKQDLLQKVNILQYPCQSLINFCVSTCPMRPMELRQQCDVDNRQ